jgi:hypothetical membrane protein
LSRHLRIAGTIGLISPFFSFACILWAIATWTPFNWINNALSDLGVQNGITPIVFNSGIVISGILFMFFATGLFPLLGKHLVGKAGASVFILSCVALVGIGIFNESFSPAHYIFSIAFFVLFPIAMFILSVSFWIEGKHRMSLFTLAMALAAAIVWGGQLTVHYVSNVAIPEFVSGLFGATWMLVASYLMLKKSDDREVLQ